MWKVALFAVAVLLGTVQGRTLGVASWDRLLAEVMQGSNTGICGPLCYIEEEKKVLEQGEDFVKGCTVYGCRSSGVHVAIIECPENVECPEDSNTIIYPGQCCMTCEGPRDEVGIFTEWEEWTPCSKSCGGGRKARRRECKIDVTAGLVECTGSILETDDCNIQGCPVPCEWEYGDFEQCNATCGDGVHQRFPTITQHPQNGGKPCPPHVNNGEPQEAPCNLHPCAIPCEWEYGEYGECSATCGGGTKTRYPNILKPAEHGGRCPAHVVIREPDTTDCTSDPCPVPCEWEWGEYGDCSATCDGGTQSRVAIIITPAQHGGYCLPEVGRPDTRACNTQDCPPACPNPDDNNCLINGVYKCIYDPDRDCVEQDDNCEFAYNPDQKDMEHDGVGDVCDNCRFLANTDQINTDGDETGNACDGDDDNDGVVDQKDNCGLKPNPTQTDRDGDRIGDECDNCPFRSNNNQADFDEDGVGNACDNCRFYPNPEQGAGDRQTYGFLCTTRPKGMDIQDYEGDEYYDDEMNLNKKGMAAEIMEKLLKMYYNE